MLLIINLDTVNTPFETPLLIVFMLVIFSHIYLLRFYEKNKESEKHVKRNTILQFILIALAVIWLASNLFLGLAMYYYGGHLVGVFVLFSSLLVFVFLQWKWRFLFLSCTLLVGSGITRYLTPAHEHGKIRHIPWVKQKNNSL